MSLSFSNYPKDIAELVRTGIAAADPALAVRRHLRRRGRSLLAGQQSYRLDQGRVFVVAVGKAAVPMALAAGEIIGDVTATIAVTKAGSADWRAVIDGSPFINPRSPFHLFTAGHPVSDANSLQATSAVVQLLSQTTADDLVLCLISGGASALLTQPRIPLEDWQQLLQLLLAAGCTIQELNTVRRRLDRVKGGGLAHLAAPALCVGLILSDVVGNPLELIGSGPTVPPDPSADASAAGAVLARYGVPERLGAGAWQRISQALAEAWPFYVASNRVHNIVVGDVRQAAMAALARSVQLGFVTQLLTSHLEGEAREVGRVAAALARDASPGHCLILGGETTVTVRGEGQGGRNLELALAAAIALEGAPNVAVASVATDGEDHTTGSAGAMVTGATATLGRQCGLSPIDYLNRNDSYTFFKELDERVRQSGSDNALPSCLLRTGSTGTNVNDLLFILAYPGG